MGGGSEPPCEYMQCHDCRCHHFVDEEGMRPSADPLGYGLFHSVVAYRVGRRCHRAPPHHRAHRHPRGHSRHHHGQYMPSMLHLVPPGPWFDSHPVPPPVLGSCPPPPPRCYNPPPPPPPPPPPAHHYGY